MSILDKSEHDEATRQRIKRKTEMVVSALNRDGKGIDDLMAVTVVLLRSIRSRLEVGMPQVWPKYKAVIEGVIGSGSGGSGLIIKP